MSSGVYQRPSVGVTMNFRVVRAVKYLEDTFADPTIHLASAARHIDVTPPHLDRLLRKHTGLTFLQQRRRIRIRHAERLLLTTMSSIKETAYACGYTSTCSFGRDFRRVHGCAPRDWRDLRTAEAAPFGYNEPLDEQDRDGGPLEDANDEAMDRWAHAYDDLNGAPENDGDR